MPFHLKYTGPAEVSTYFMPRGVANPAFVSKDETPSVEEKITVAAFRGRRLQAKEIGLPEGYTGVVLTAPPTSSSSSLIQLKAEINQEIKVTKTRVEEIAESGSTSGLRRSPRKRKADLLELELPVVRKKPNKRVMKKFSMDTDSEDEDEGKLKGDDDADAGEEDAEGKVEGEETLVAEEDQSTLEAVAYEDDRSVAAASTRILTAASSSISLDISTSFTPLDSLSPFLDAPTHQKEVRMLSPTGRFDAFTLWHPDGPVDTGRDEYCRALGEWIELGKILHAD